MNRQRKSLWWYRNSILIGCVCIMAGLFGWRAFSREEVGPVALVCVRTATDMVDSSLDLPDTRYLVTDSYGWFDREHFNTGNPHRVLADVQKTVANGGGIITIHQGLHNDLLGYTALYHVSGHLGETDVTATALGIYYDWSVRFEAWQARPPHGLSAPLTPFAIEDLPSQYLGFYAHAHRTSIEELFACHLGPVSGSDEGPPDFIASRATAAADGWTGIARLQNRTFTPMVKTEKGWLYANWPKRMPMRSTTAGPSTWQFLSESTWYGDDETHDLLLVDAFPRAHRQRHLN